MVTLLTNPFFLVFASITVSSLAATIAHYWHKARRDELEASLKHEMLQRGMSADDIVKVLIASKTKALKERSAEVAPEVTTLSEGRQTTADPT